MWVFVLAGCNDYSFGDEVPQWPSSQVPLPPEMVQIDKVLQVNTPKVDILWMVDNSCSMGDDQQILIEHIPIFMDYFLESGLDYHVGVVPIWTGGQADGVLREANGQRWVDLDTTDPIGTFSQMANMGATAPIEFGLGNIYLALETNENTVNAGFLRDDAALHTIALSDQEDHTPPSIVTIDEFIPWYAGMKAVREDRTFSSIVNIARADPEIGRKYLEVTEVVGGVAWDLGDGDWDGALNELGLQTSGYRREYFLSRLPVIDTIALAVLDGAVELQFDAGEDWLYSESRNSISFISYIPNALATVEISYTVLANTQGDN